MCLASVAPSGHPGAGRGHRARRPAAPACRSTRARRLPVRLDVDEPLSVGADRIVNALAAVELYREDTIVVDFGTATTFDCVTADGRFLGGVIMPGLRTAADQLTRRTAKLPATELRRAGARDRTPHRGVHPGRRALRHRRRGGRHRAAHPGRVAGRPAAESGGDRRARRRSWPRSPPRSRRPIPTSRSAGSGSPPGTSA